jgi:hypothetical protein
LTTPLVEFDTLRQEIKNNKQGKNSDKFTSSSQNSQYYMIGGD